MGSRSPGARAELAGDRTPRDGGLASCPNSLPMKSVAMLGISEKDWRVEERRARDPCRGARLECCGSPDELIDDLAQSISTIEVEDIRIGVDSKECRATVQFRVTPELYDWFYNGRTGYRGTFWISPENGMKFNGRIVAAVAKVLTERLAETIPARKIRVRDDGAWCDVGQIIGYRRQKLLRSLAPKISKIWIAEQLMGASTGLMKDTLCLLPKAEKLSVPRWPGGGEGLRALYCPQHSLLCGKGGVFIEE